MWLNTHVLPAFSDRILAIDTEVAQCCAKLHVPDPRADRDAVIAATALVHGMTVVTRNIDDFKATGVDILNPWNPKYLDKQPLTDYYPEEKQRRQFVSSLFDKTAHNYDWIIRAMSWGSGNYYRYQAL